MLKIIVVYASFGYGHKKAAEALAESIDGKACDLLDFCSAPVSKIYAWFYIFISHHFRHIWQFVFFLAKKKFLSTLINLLHRVLFASFFKYLNQEKPDVVITTHFFPADLAAYIKHGEAFKLVSVITDIRVHPIWVNPAIDCYFTTFNITKDDLVFLGVDPARIISGFVPLRRGFSQPDSPEVLRNKFGLDSRPVILFVSSSRGVFPALTQSLSSLLKRFNIFVIHGNNKKLQRYLQGVKSSNLHFFPFYEKIWELMHLSSIIVTKPGGMTIFECAFYKKPIIFPHYIPGQEKENMDVLIKAGVARFANNRERLLAAVDFFSQKQDYFQNNYPFQLQDIRPALDSLIVNCLCRKKTALNGKNR